MGVELDLGMASRPHHPATVYMCLLGDGAPPGGGVRRSQLVRGVQATGEAMITARQVSCSAPPPATERSPQPSRPGL